MPVARHPPHRSVRAAFLHTAPTSSVWRENDQQDTGAISDLWEASGRLHGENGSREDYRVDLGASVPGTSDGRPESGRP